MTQLSKFERGEFVAWDGEGVTRRKRHDYILFASSHGVSLTNPKGFATVDLLDAFIDGVERAPHAVHVGFAISYDVNMLLRDLRPRVLKKLWESETVHWHPRTFGPHSYILSYRPRKFFRVTRLARDGSKVTGTWWDVWPFFQSSFVKALEKYRVMTDQFREQIQRMKLRRSTFRVRDLPAIQAYNAQECAALVQLMDALLASLKAANITIRRWDGPGAIAAAMLAEREYKACISAPVPEGALQAAQHAYYGGRIECVQYGHTTQPVYHYDINSAYPAAMRSLPCRRKGCGRWVRGEHGTFTVYHVTWNFPRDLPLYPFAWRSHRGSVFFPRAGEAWAWSPEVEAARSFMPVGSFTIVDAWSWKADCDHGPATSWIADAYQARQAAKARGDGAEHALKLGLNSLYGKLAQRVGARWKDDQWVPPPFHDLAGAGYVTSTVRAQLYTAAMQAPHACVMLATDGIYSTVPLTLPHSPDKRLGEWTYELHAGATVVQSGVYFLDDADGSERVFSRGFDLESLDRDAILTGWRDHAVAIAAHHERFIGLGAALQFQSRWPLWRTWVREKRALALHPWGTKRAPMLTRGSNHPGDASRGLLATLPTRTERFWTDFCSPWGRMTTPSELPWRDAQVTVTAEMDRFQRADDESEDALL